jgi:hypothetical protein
MCTLLSLINSTYGVHARSKSGFAVINYHPVNTLKKSVRVVNEEKQEKLNFPHWDSNASPLNFWMEIKGRSTLLGPVGYPPYRVNPQRVRTWDLLPSCPI